MVQKKIKRKLLQENCCAFVIPKIIVQPQSELATSTPEPAGQTTSLLLNNRDDRVDSQLQVSAELFDK